MAPRIFSPTNTRRVYPASPITSARRQSIARLFIIANSFIPSAETPSGLHDQTRGLFSDSLSRQIKTLEEDGKNFIEDLQRLLYIVDKRTSYQFRCMTMKNHHWKECVITLMKV